jgi:salicylate hydroxylase
MEDSLALGLVLHGVTDTSQIEERLAIYENVRRNRIASIQILSNFGFDEAVPDELVDFLEGRLVPSKYCSDLFALCPAVKSYN